MTSSTWRPAGDVQVLEEDPGLLDGVPDDAAEALRRFVVVPARWANPGAWAPADETGPWRRCLGLLVLDGLLVRSVRLEGRDAPHLIGPGALLRPWSEDHTGAAVPHRISWRVEEPTTVAVLDTQFLAIVQAHPAVLCRLLDRAIAQEQAIAFQLAIAHVRSAEERMLLLLWHLADRWGVVTSDGVLLKLRVRQEVLAHLVCLRRPTASSALADLARAGAITPVRGGGWRLHRAPSAAPGPSATMDTVAPRAA